MFSKRKTAAPLISGHVKTLHRAVDSSAFCRVVSESYNPVSALSFSQFSPSRIFTPIVLLQKNHGVVIIYIVRSANDNCSL